MKHSAVTLEDKYEVDSDRFYLTGTQALVRLPLLQRQLDVAAGLNTAGFVSGYRGSPLGQVDIQMWSARKYLAESQYYLSIDVVDGEREIAFQRDAAGMAFMGSDPETGRGSDRQKRYFSPAVIVRPRIERAAPSPAAFGV